MRPKPAQLRRRDEAVSRGSTPEKIQQLLARRWPCFARGNPAKLPSRSPDFASNGPPRACLRCEGLARGKSRAGHCRESRSKLVRDDDASDCSAAKPRRCNGRRVSAADRMQPRAATVAMGIEGHYKLIIVQKSAAARAWQWRELVTGAGPNGEANSCYRPRAHIFPLSVRPPAVPPSATRAFVMSPTQIFFRFSSGKRTARRTA